MKKDMLRLRDGSHLDPDHVLGFITIFTVPDKSVLAVDLAKAWAAEALDPALIPEARKPVDDFRTACRKVETRKGGSLVNGHKTEVKVDEVTNQGPECIYQITRMVRDAANQVIDHPKAMTLIFNKPMADSGQTASGDCIQVKPRDPATFGALKGLADNILQDYDATVGVSVPGQKIRNAVRDTLHGLGAENLRRGSGGVYFVPKDGVDTVESLERVCTGLYGDAADFYYAPQVNVKGVQKMVAESHVRNVQDRAEGMLVKISERLKNPNKVRKDLLTNLMQERRELGAHRRRYIEMLGQRQKLVTETMTMVDESLERLMEQAV